MTYATLSQFMAMTPEERRRVTYLDLLAENMTLREASRRLSDAEEYEGEAASRGLDGRGFNRD